jgi:cell division protein FtsN
MLGLIVAAGIAIYFFKTPIPFVNRNPAGKAGVAGPDAKTTSKTEEKPRFDFYRILPGQEEPVSEKQLKDAAKQVGKAGSEPAKDLYFIQAGSFQNPADADNLKAKLALLGLEAGVEPTSVPEKGTWYRVRLGPLANIDEINRLRSQLAQNGIDASLVKVKPAP